MKIKYAVITDIHGNYPALLSVLADAKREEVNTYIFAGDYFLDFPYPNETVDVIKNMENAYVIKGNKEDYLTQYNFSEPKDWIYEQYAPLYRAYHDLSEQNRNYLIGLSESIILETPDRRKKLFITHSAYDLFEVMS